MTCNSMISVAAEEIHHSTAPFRQAIAHRLDVRGPPQGGPTPPAPRQNTCVLPPMPPPQDFYMLDDAASEIARTPFCANTRRKTQSQS